MTRPLARPTFFEGQVLASSDLNALVDYARAGLELHETAEHLWGVAFGLTLKEEDGVYLQPGVAIDPAGRRIVLAERRQLHASELKEQVAVSGSSTLYPVYVVGTSSAARQSTGQGRCAVDAPTRYREGASVVFGPAGSEQSMLDVELAPGAPAGDGLRVLVGFVELVADKLTGPTTSSGEARVRHAGVRASEVEAHDGRLALRTRQRGGVRYAFTVTENDSGGCELRFGKQEGDAVTETFTVNEKGDIAFAGELKPRRQSTGPVIESGLVPHGLKVPLPVGITESAVSGESVKLHVQVTPWHVGVKNILFAGNPTPALGRPVRVEVDENRTVTCIIRWLEEPPPAMNPKTADLPGVCRYLVIAVPK